MEAFTGGDADAASGFVQAQTSGNQNMEQLQKTIESVDGLMKKSGQGIQTFTTQVDALMIKATEYMEKKEIPLVGDIIIIQIPELINSKLK